MEAYNCVYDRVTIYDGNKETKIAILCGTMGRNKVYHSSGSRMLVTFYSDGSEQHKGFKAKFERRGKISLFVHNYFASSKVCL